MLQSSKTSSDCHDSTLLYTWVGKRGISSNFRPVASFNYGVFNFVIISKFEQKYGTGCAPRYYFKTKTGVESWAAYPMYFGILLHNPPTNFQVNWFKESFLPKITAYRRSSWFENGRCIHKKNDSHSHGFEVVALCCQFGHPGSQNKKRRRIIVERNVGGLRVRKVHLVGMTNRNKKTCLIWVNGRKR